MATLDEQETTVTYTRADNVVRIYTAVPRHIRALRGNDRATETRSGDDWAEFTVPATEFDPVKGFKRRVTMSDEQRQAASDRMKALHTR